MPCIYAPFRVCLHNTTQALPRERWGGMCLPCAHMAGAASAPDSPMRISRVQAQPKWKFLYLSRSSRWPGQQVFSLPTGVRSMRIAHWTHQRCGLKAEHIVRAIPYAMPVQQRRGVVVLTGFIRLRSVVQIHPLQPEKSMDLSQWRNRQRNGLQIRRLRVRILPGMPSTQRPIAQR